MSKDSSVPSDGRLYGRLLRYAFAYKLSLLLSFLGYLVYSIGNVLLADLTQFLLDSLGEQRNGMGLGFVAQASMWIWPPGDKTALDYARIAVPVAAVVLSLGRALGYFAGSYFMSKVARSVVHTLRTQLFDVLIRAPRAHVDNYSTGELLSKITFNVEQVSGAASDALKTMLREGLSIIALVAYMLYLNWELTAVFFVVAPAIGLVVHVVGRHFRRYSRRIQESMGSVTEVSAESLAALDDIRIYGATDEVSERFHDASRFNRNQSLKLAFVQAISTPIIQTLLALALGALFWFALDPNVLASFSAGSLVAFITAAAQLGKPIRTMSNIQSIIQRGLAAAEDIFDQLDTPAEPDAGSVSIEGLSGDVQFNQVAFRYPGAQSDAISDISFVVAEGTTTAIVGRSGSGKSTLVKLLARFYEPNSGDIAIAGHDIATIKLTDYRRSLGFVPQQITLFSESVANNIALGDSVQAERSDVEQAATWANAQEFIKALEHGFDTEIGEQGVGLSGGQRQRIAIARALLKDAPILILDEATSALDNESEALIQRSLQKHAMGKTTFVIAHRLSTIENADQVLVMDQGLLVAHGSHNDLIETSDVYRSLYQQGFSDD
ncbi:MAG: lipid A export permease/ATP-binding protein MsbA [Cellvibrionales bacterium TMED21]|nr:lipid A export permease/ATP-binding protein MsbA [Halieaceae bacterium]OUT66514.1 MAG: lipid A export permease/ATP-binding protein MsbA [Cellvibrionales bacterium TMED21]